MITNHNASRKNMVDCQLQTNGIIDPLLIDAYYDTPREKFCPEGTSDHCYIDSNLPLDSNGSRFLLDPMCHAKMIQALCITPEEIVLDVAGATGYSSAIISRMASTVIVLDENQDFLDQAVTIYDELGLCNLIQFKGHSLDGCPHYAPYNAILVNGALGKAPEKLIEQLIEGGRLVYIHRDNSENLGCATLIQKGTDNTYTTQHLFKASAPYICPEAKPNNAFSF